MSQLTFPAFSELNEREKERVIDLILSRLGLNIEAYKWEDSPDREISLGRSQLPPR
jgi:hypothetical protein